MTKSLMELKKTLPELVLEEMELSRILLESGGELTPELEKQLEINAENLLQKVDAYVYREDQFQMQADYFKRKADAYNRISKMYSSQIDGLRNRIKYIMKEMGKDVIKGDEYRYTLGKSQPKLTIEDESLIPSEFTMIVQKVELDKQKIKEALASGFQVPGTRLEENGTLRVYENTGKE